VTAVPAGSTVVIVPPLSTGSAAAVAGQTAAANVNGYVSEQWLFPRALNLLNRDIANMLGKPVDNNGPVILAIGSHVNPIGPPSVNKALAYKRSRSVACYVNAWLLRNNFPNHYLRVGVFRKRSFSESSTQAKDAAEQFGKIFYANDKASFDDLDVLARWSAGLKRSPSGADGGMKKYCSDNAWKLSNFQDAWLGGAFSSEGSQASAVLNSLSNALSAASTSASKQSERSERSSELSKSLSAVAGSIASALSTASVTSASNSTAASSAPSSTILPLNSLMALLPTIPVQQTKRVT